MWRGASDELLGMVDTDEREVREGDCGECRQCAHGDTMVV